MCAAEPVDHIQGVRADEQDRRHRVEPAHAGAAPGERERAGAREQRLDLHPPQRALDAERRERVGEQRVEGAVGGGDLLPVVADVAVDRVAGDRDGAVQVRVEAVLDAHAGVGDVAEDVRREQNGPDEDDQRGAPRPGRSPSVWRSQGTGGACERDQPAVGARGDEQGDQEDAVAEALAEPGQPAGDRGLFRDQRRVAERHRRARSRRSPRAAAAPAGRRGARATLRAARAGRVRSARRRSRVGRARVTIDCGS